MNPLTPKTIALAIKLADERAFSDIESIGCNVPDKQLVEDGWRDVAYDEETKSALSEIVEYAELRGILERHPQNPNWVRVKKADEVIEVEEIRAAIQAPRQ